MARVIGSHQAHPLIAPRSLVQKVCIIMGILFLVIGLVGIIMPGFMGMHLSLAHNLIHLVSGSLALWCGYAEDSRKAYTFCVGFGCLYGLLAVAGYLMGQPGYPAVGHLAAEQNLLRVIPNVLELGTEDHVVHFLLASVFLLAAFAWKRRDVSVTRRLVDEQTRPVDLPNSESDLYRSDLGVSDVNRRSDRERRTDFENRI